jgi:hypothetical protein
MSSITRRIQRAAARTTTVKRGSTHEDRTVDLFLTRLLEDTADRAVRKLHEWGHPDCYRRGTEVVYASATRPDNADEILQQAVDAAVAEAR